MPGIFGLIDPAAVNSHRAQQALVALVERMGAAMRYGRRVNEPPVSLPSLGACVGRLRQAGEPPADRADGAVTVIAVADDDAGWPALIEAYRRRGVEGFGEVPDVGGGFLADAERGKCLLFNDRYGRERLFVHVDGTRVAFASEAKAILAIAPATRTFDTVGLAEWLACGCTIGRRSLFRDIEVVDAGTVLTFDGSASPHRHRYFHPSRLEALKPAAGPEFLDGFSTSLRAAVTAATRNTPRVGMSLTGGLDSRMIMASLEAAPGTVPCYTFGSMYRTTGDVAVGRAVAACCGQPHQVLELGAGFLRAIPEHLEEAAYISDGYLGLSGAAELYVNRQAREIAPVRMTGNWGGELMRGVRAFKYAMPKGGFLRAELATTIEESAAAFSTTSRHALSAALFQQIPYQGYGRYAIERSQMAMRSPFLADDVVTWLYRAPAEVRASAAPAIIRRRPGLLAIPTDLGALGRGRGVVRRRLRRALIKAEYLTSHGAPDWLAAVAARVPEGIIETRFLGVDKFQHFRYWMRRDLSAFVRDSLIGGPGNGLVAWFDPAAVGRMVEAHIDGRANYTNELDKLLTLAAVQKRLFSAFEAIQ
jgi:asparagine synthase (glutamine-hydrolysing)